MFKINERAVRGIYNLFEKMFNKKMEDKKVL